MGLEMVALLTYDLDKTIKELLVFLYLMIKKNELRITQIKASIQCKDDVK